MSKTEQAIAQMEAWARDDSHGYDQQYRWGERGDYDCSAAVITVWERAGVPVKTKGATYTGNMYSAFLACGFRDVTTEIRLGDGAGLRRGDVLLNILKHTAMYCGEGQEVEASINERGTATGGQPGDQTGREFLIRPYRNYPWDRVLRYVGEEDLSTRPGSSLEMTGGRPAASSGTASGGKQGCTVMIPTVRRRDSGAAVAACQAALRQRGFDPRWIDGEAGARTEAMIRAFQRSRKLVVDGVCGAETWKNLMN